MREVQLNPLVEFTHPIVSKGSSSSFLWDLRDPPSTAARAVHSLSSQYHGPGGEFATNPPISALRVVCDILPYPWWRIKARNDGGVTVRDVFDAIYNTLHVPLTNTEWDGLSEKQKLRVQRAFEVRWSAAAQPQRERKQGLRRVDCLLGSTTFAGLSMSDDSDFDCVLSLGRNSRA